MMVTGLSQCNEDNEKSKYLTTVVRNDRFGLLLRFPDFPKVIKINLPRDERVPASGFFLGENVFESNMVNKLESALDIGTGKYAAIEFYLAGLWRFKKIDGVEINSNDFAIAKNTVEENGLSHAINLSEGNLFEPVAERKYDLIISNIAQLPKPPHVPVSQHDHGGFDGWKFLRKIIDDARNHLKDRGFLSLLAFDFLGVFERRADTIPSLSERLRSNGFEVVHSASYMRHLRRRGMTHNALEHILEVYPKAVFYDANGNSIQKKEQIVKLAEEDRVSSIMTVVTAKAMP